MIDQMNRFLLLSLSIFLPIVFGRSEINVLTSKLSSTNQSGILYWMCLEPCGSSFNLTNQLIQLQNNADIIKIVSYTRFGLINGKFEVSQVNGSYVTGIFICVNAFISKKFYFIYFMCFILFYFCHFICSQKICNHI
jgi:hypothetical protein